MKISGTNFLLSKIYPERKDFCPFCKITNCNPKCPSGDLFYILHECPAVAEFYHKIKQSGPLKDLAIGSSKTAKLVYIDVPGKEGFFLNTIQLLVNDFLRESASLETLPTPPLLYKKLKKNLFPSYQKNKHIMPTELIGELLDDIDEFLEKDQS